MSTTITDLDELVGADKQVRLAGKVYRLPSDIPVELYLRINHAAERELTEAELVQELYADVLELFRHGNPKLQKLPIGLGQLMAAIPAIYGAGDAGQEERPTTPRTRGGSSRATASRPARRSRS